MHFLFNIIHIILIHYFIYGFCENDEITDNLLWT
jgi:hypothetical protein